MVKGLVLMRWDERSGAEIIGTYPPEEQLIDDMVLFQIYGQHQFSGEAGIVSLSSGQTNLLSYYSGPIDNHYILLILEEAEDPDDYESALINYSQPIFQLKQKNYDPILKETYNHIKCCFSYNHSQILAAYLKDEYKKLLLDRLRIEGVVNKSELRIWLHDKYRSRFLDIDALLNELVKIGLIKISSVQGFGISSEYVFLIHDIITFRKPSKRILNNGEIYGIPDKLKEDVTKIIDDFFKQYKPSAEDTQDIIEALLNERYYKILMELKDKTRTREELEVLFDEGAPESINKMEQMQFIQWIDDTEGGGFYFLKSDLYIDLIFPDYILSILKEKYNQNALAKEIIQEYLIILENAVKS